MKTIRLKDGIVEITDNDTKHLNSIIEVLAVKTLDEITINDFNTALTVEKLCDGETIDLGNNKKIRMTPDSN